MQDEGEKRTSYFKTMIFLKPRFRRCDRTSAKPSADHIQPHKGGRLGAVPTNETLLSSMATRLLYLFASSAAFMTAIEIRQFGQF